ncbi:MAG TPA: NADH-quinone oxidoreductase subunit C [Vicinamibacterales bacterium]|jgi:NADH-quinone oxidoreductase subunit C|nr:NADH-quinone oxidoreductase subunit C [Vicinamibacterales bacterium]
MNGEQARASLASTFGVDIAAGVPLVVTVAPEQWEALARYARDTVGCLFFNFLTAVDWKEQGLEVVARVDNLEENVGLMLKTKLGPGVTSCASLTPVYRGADWMERECFDMFGIHFDHHPDLRRILLEDGWEGHPLLKSYAVDTPHPPYR